MLALRPCRGLAPAPFANQDDQDASYDRDVDGAPFQEHDDVDWGASGEMLGAYVMLFAAIEASAGDTTDFVRRLDALLAD